MNEEFKEVLEQMQASIAQVLQMVSEQTGANPSGETTEPIEEPQTSTENVEIVNDKEPTDNKVVEETPKANEEPTKEPTNEETKEPTDEETKEYVPTEEEIDEAVKMLSV